MTTSINAEQFSLLRHQTLSHHPTKPNPYSSLKFLFNPNISQIKLNHLKPSNALLKPFLKPSISDPLTPTPLNPSTNVLCACTVWGHSLFSGAWGPTGSTAARGDVRVWSKRRPGSKKKTKRMVITIECTKCLKNMYTTEKNKNVTEKTGYGSQRKDKGNKSEMLQLKKHCPNCKEHTLHKEIKK